jgi:SNF family Na+-dependent transporter
VAKVRDQWGSRLGIILAVAGSAIGLGNFLRFPAKAAANGGGAFMIPYFVSLILLGIPLMWIEWTLGRYGGGFGHGTAPGIFHNVQRKNRFLKYFGVIGIVGPLVINMYYIFIESWTLAYSVFFATGKYTGITDQAQMKSMLSAFQGVSEGSSLMPAYMAFLVTFAVNAGVIWFGIRGGIERLCKVAMPLLFVCALVLCVRVVSLGAPMHPDWTVNAGFGFMWNPDFHALANPRVWLEAAGQVFFTLSVGIGVILTYASYLKKGDDVVLSGLTAATTNEFAEVILGGSIIIPAAFVFFGPIEIKNIAASGVFNLGFVTMPLVLNQLPWSSLLGFCWFFLLFLAGVTSSVSLMQPVVAFLEDEFRLSRNKAVGIMTVALFILCQPAIFFLKNGVVDELDFWGGTVFLVVFATIEAILFAWVLGIDRAWEEIHFGAHLGVPRIFKFIIKYVTPLLLLTILVTWLATDWLPVIRMEGVAPEGKPYILGTRIGLMILLGLVAAMVMLVWRKRNADGKESAT